MRSLQDLNHFRIVLKTKIRVARFSEKHFREIIQTAVRTASLRGRNAVLKQNNKSQKLRQKGPVKMAEKLYLH